MAQQLAIGLGMLLLCAFDTTTAIPVGHVLGNKSIAPLQAVLTIGDINILAVTDVHG